MSTRTETDRRESRRRKPSTDDIRQAGALAEGTPEGDEFLNLCMDRLEILLATARNGHIPNHKVIDETMSVEYRNLFGAKVARRAWTTQDSWKYTKLGVYKNGSLDIRHTLCLPMKDQALDYPVHDGLVLVIESRADWVEKQLGLWLEEEKGLERTTLIRTFFHALPYQTCITSLCMPRAMAFGLPLHKR